MMAWSAGWCEVCHGARSGEGPVLASLAMLAPKKALRVAPGGRPLELQAGTGKQALQPNRKAGLA